MSPPGVNPLEADAARLVRLHDPLARAGIALLLLLVGLWAVSSLWLPFGCDHGAFGYVADVIRRGGMPYRDVWEIKGPLALYLYAAAQNLLGPQMWSVRLFDLIALAAGSLAGFGLVARLAGKGAALFGVSMMVLFFASFGNWYTAQPDGWAAMALVVLVAALSVPPTARRVVGAAGLVGLLSLLKPTYAVYGVLVLVALGGAREMPGRVRVAAASAAVFVLPIAAAVAWFAWRGALPDLIDQHLRFNAERIATDPNLQISPLKVLHLTLAIVTSSIDLAVALPFAALGIAVALRLERRTGLLLLLWPLLALATIGAQRKFLQNNYSWHTVYPPLILGAAIGLGWLWRESARSPWPARVLPVAAALLLAYHAGKGPAGQVAQWARLMAGRQTLEQYRASFEGPLPWLGGLTPVQAFGFSVTRDLRLARWLRERTRPDEQVFVWADPLVNHFSDRPSLTPITSPEAFTIWGSAERRARYRADLVAGVLERRAAIIAIPQMALRPGGPAEFSVRTSFPELIAALDQTYRRIGAFEDLELYEPR